MMISDLSNVRADDVGYDLYIFDITYQQVFTASQPIKAEFKFDGVESSKWLCFAVKLVSVSSDEQLHFDLIQFQFPHKIIVFFH